MNLSIDPAIAVVMLSPFVGSVFVYRSNGSQISTGSVTLSAPNVTIDERLRRAIPMMESKM